MPRIEQPKPTEPAPAFQLPAGWTIADVPRCVTLVKRGGSTYDFDPLTYPGEVVVTHNPTGKPRHADRYLCTVDEARELYVSCRRRGYEVF